jgi:hypothetical protein
VKYGVYFIWSSVKTKGDKGDKGDIGADGARNSGYRGSWLKGDTQG